MNYKSEKYQEFLRENLFGNEKFWIDNYIKYGPEKLQEISEIPDNLWEILFDYLVFEHDLFLKIVNQNLSFFEKFFVKNGALEIRGILKADDAKYGKAWDEVFDYLAIEKGLLCRYVLENRRKYSISLKARGGKFTRILLGLYEDKYKENWKEILGVLENILDEGTESSRILEEGLKKFSLLFNQMREQRKF